MVDYTNTFDQFGAHLKILRKTQAQHEHAHEATDATHSKRLLTAEFNTSLTDEEVSVTKSKAFLEDSVRVTLQGLFTSQRSNFETSFFPVLDDELDTSQSDKAAGAIRYRYDTFNGSGQIAISKREGRLGRLRQQMIDDSETIQENTVSVGTLTAQGSNKGVLSATTKTGSDHSLPGTVIAEVSSDTVGSPKLRVELDFTTRLADGVESVLANNLLTVGQSWEDGPTGLTLKLDLGSVVEAGDDGNMISGITITTPNETDTDKGIVYVRVTRQATAPIWLIEVSDGQSFETIRGSATADGTTGTASISITTANGMVVAFTFHKANANTKLPSSGNTDSDITLDIKTPRIGDRWTLAVTNNKGGNFATKIAESYRASLNSDGSPTITDSDAASVSVS